MNTPAHLILGAAVFARPGRPFVNAAALAGGLLPDLSLYLLAGWSLFVLGLPPQTVFGELYYSAPWQAIFAIDNSLPIWGAMLVVGVALRRDVLIAFAGAGTLHLIADFLLHHDDARRHFWPLSDWVFLSPVSYWDDRHYGAIAAPIEVLASLLLCAVLWRRFRGVPARAMVLVAGLAELAPAILFALMFQG